jgi:murein L,D-transpeptidase YafK
VRHVCLGALSVLLLAPVAWAHQIARSSPRWRAIEARRPGLQARFVEAGVPFPSTRIFIRVFKRERVLELWGRADGGHYQLVRTYRVCAASGRLGPKRRLGDEQVPEGFYRVTSMSPWTRFHAALGLDYPNASDRILGYRPALGSAILIHGKCVSIGCIAIQDGPSGELFLAAHETQRRRGGPIPVHIFPTRLDDDGLAWLRQKFADQPKLLGFWQGLRPGFLAFERTRRPPAVRVDRRGRYLVTP